MSILFNRAELTTKAFESTIFISDQACYFDDASNQIKSIHSNSVQFSLWD